MRQGGKDRVAAKVIELKGNKASFARDLACSLLLEFERLLVTSAPARQSAEYASAMSRRRPLRPQQLAEIAEAARQAEYRRTGDAVRAMIQGTATAPEPGLPPRQPLPPKGNG
jgi:hypothetical protein